MAFPFDDNLRNYLRSNSMFGGDMSPRQMNPQQPSMGANPNMLSPEEEEYYNMGDFDYTKAFNEQYHPESVAGDRLNSMMERMPQRENPRLWRRIAATAFSAGAPENVERTLYGPYHQKLQDWQTGLAPALKAAELEKSNNANLRSVAASVASGERAEHNLKRQLWATKAGDRQATRRLDQQAGRYATLERQGDERIDVSKTMASIAEKRAKGGQFEEDDYGDAWMVYKDATREPIVGWRGLTWRQKQDAINAGRVASRADRVKLEWVQEPGTNRRVLVSTNLDTNEATPIRWVETPTPKPQPGGGKPETDDGKPPPGPVVVPDRESDASKGLGQQRDIENEARRARSAFPNLAKYLKYDKNGKFLRIVAPGEQWYDNISNDDYNKLFESIFGKEGTPNTRTDLADPKVQDKITTARTATAAPKKTPRPGHIRVRNKVTGKEGDWPQGTPLQPGFEEVK